MEGTCSLGNLSYSQDSFVLAVVRGGMWLEEPGTHMGLE